MKKNDITYEHRVFTNRHIDVESMEVGTCTSKFIKGLTKKDIVDGRFYHTSDTDAWFFCWNGEVQRLNLKEHTDIHLALNEVERLIDETNAAVDINKSTIKEAQDAVDANKVAIKEAQDAAKAAFEAADAIADIIEVKADKSVLEALSKVVETKADGSIVSALSDKVDAIKIPSLEGYATEKWVNDKNYATKSEIPSLNGYATETFVTSQNYAKKSEIPSLDEYAKKSEIPNMNNYYTKEEINSLIGNAVNITNTILS